jgi:hypothetical protein
MFIAAARRLWAAPCLSGLLPLRGVYGLRPVYEVYCRCTAFMGCALFMRFIAAARRLWAAPCL